MVKEYDFIIAGGGVAGLSLLYHLLQSPLRDRAILVVDRAPKTGNDRRLSFWTDRPTPFDEVAYRSWQYLRFSSESYANVFDLGAYRYSMIRALDFYRFVRQEASAYPMVEFLAGRVERIEDEDDRATVIVGREQYAGRWVFDSLFELSTFRPKPTRYRYLQQHFKGWEIETVDAVFDPQVATLLDMRTPQENELRFFYTLPFSETHALIEYVLLGAEQYDLALKTYLERTMGITEYRILAKEGGVTPLTDYPFPRRTGRHILTIGIKGGRVKPCTGYAFTRIQRDAAAIVRSLLEAGHPFDLPSGSRLHRLCDSLLLEVMDRNGERVTPIFSALFEHNPIERVLRFLDEGSTLRETIALGVTLPLYEFVPALFQMTVPGRLLRGG